MDDTYILDEPNDISVESVRHDITTLTVSDDVTIRQPQTDLYVVLENE